MSDAESGCVHLVGDEFLRSESAVLTHSFLGARAHQLFRRRAKKNSCVAGRKDGESKDTKTGSPSWHEINNNSLV
jgi:hypothetical protein